MVCEQDPLLDEWTGEWVNFLFQFRDRAVTVHLLRASSVTALANVPDGMASPELMAWCGHKEPKATMWYIRLELTRLAGSFARADPLFHTAAVLLDHDAVVSGAAWDGAPYKSYDLGDSYCTNAFWSTCPHRTACAGCFYNLPKSSKVAALTARASVTRMLEEVQLSPDGRDAAEGDGAKLDGLIEKLKDTPALDGRTPREIGCGGRSSNTSGCGGNGCGSR